jgi:threonine/homoserine/homoserine lactone efflux protein
MYVTIANMATPWLQWFHRYARGLSYTAAAILVVAGILGLVRKYKPQRPSSKRLAINKSKYFRIWGSGFLLNTLNPALILQWIVAATATAAEPGFYRLVFFACCLGLVLGVDVLKVLLADNIRRRLTLRKIMYLQRFSAFCLLLFGIGIFILTIFNIELKTPAEKQSAHQQIQSADTKNLTKA